jgi:hypothetical protein
MASRELCSTPGSGARSLLTWGIDLWHYVNGKAIVNGINLKEMEASDMLDVLHYFFEEDMYYASAEQAEGRDRSREIIYRDFYNASYPYASQRNSNMAGGQGITKNFDDIEEEEIVPFDPMQKQKAVKPFIPPTAVDARAEQPFGITLDGPITR